MPTPTERFGRALGDNASAFDVELRPDQIERLGDYYELLMKWNDRLHLVAPCSPEEFATRHILESLLLLRHLAPNARVVDIGSGAGLPILPCLIVRDDLNATLFEASPKKAVFLRQALHCANSGEPAQLIIARFEETAVPAAEFFTCRALDRFSRWLPTLIKWVPAGSTLLLFAGGALLNQIEALLPAAQVHPIPGSQRRFLVSVCK